MKIIGIDPGLTGALALIDGHGLVEVVDMPVLAKRVQGNEFADIVTDWGADMAVVEDIHAMPRGAIASFSLGWSCGVATCALQVLQHPFVKIRPNTWKGGMGLRGKDKEASRLLAIELWPDMRDSMRLKKHDGRAEAALIAEYWHREYADEVTS